MRSTGIVERAAALAPMLGEYRSFGDEHARLAAESVAALRDAGMFGLWTPADAGGEEATLRQGFEVVALIAAADPSAGWYVMNTTALSHAATLVDPHWWPRLFSPPLPNTGLAASVGGTLRACDGGFRLSGSWPMMTGVLDASWAVVNAKVVTEDARTLRRSAVVAVGDLDVVETWRDAAAMRGTGSHEVLADGVFVPDGLVVDLAAPPAIDRPLYRCSYFVRSAVVNTAIVVGILHGAVDAAVGELNGKVSTIFGTRASDSTALLELMADAAATLAVLEAGTLGLIDRLWDHVVRGDEPPLALRANLVGGVFRAVAAAREEVSALYARSSRAAFRRGHPLEQALRDIHAVAYGLDTLRPLHHAAGRAALGDAPGMPL